MERAGRPEKPDASIQLTFTASKGHTTTAHFHGVVTSRSNVFSDARINGTITLQKGLGDASRVATARSWTAAPEVHGHVGDDDRRMRPNTRTNLGEGGPRRRRRGALISLSLSLLLVFGTLTGVSRVVPLFGAPHRARRLTGIHKIQHVVVIMQENRSFDSYFGTFPGADGIPMANGEPTVCVPDPADRRVRQRRTSTTPTTNGGGPHGAAERDGRHQRRQDGRLRRAGRRTAQHGLRRTRPTRRARTGDRST